MRKERYYVTGEPESPRSLIRSVHDDGRVDHERYDPFADAWVASHEATRFISSGDTILTKLETSVEEAKRRIRIKVGALVPADEQRAIPQPGPE